MTENTIAEKITKIRKLRNLERDEFSTIIGNHLSTVQNWEIDNVPPPPENINNICNIFNIDLIYFDEYYYLYYNPPIEKIIKWKIKNAYTNKKCCSILEINYSTFSRLINEPNVLLKKIIAITLKMYSPFSYYTKKRTPLAEAIIRNNSHI